MSGRAYRQGSGPQLGAVQRGPFRQTDHYVTGGGDPPLRADPGAGGWRSKPVTAAVAAQWAALHRLVGVPTTIYPGFNATRHLRHYLNNTGGPLTIDLEDMISSVRTASRAMLAEFRQAQRFIQTLPPGTHHFTSRSGETAYNFKHESADWFFATGGYTYWGQGVARVRPGAGGLRYEVDFTYKIYDRYNWDGGKSVTIGGVTVTDDFMGEFHRQGLAREYDCFGSVQRRIEWTGAAATLPDEAILKGAGR